MFDDVFEHVPADVAPVGVAGHAPHDEDGFDGFRAEEVLGGRDGEVALWERVRGADDAGLAGVAAGGPVPGRFVPDALGGVFEVGAGEEREGFGHDAGGGVGVGPDAAFGEGGADFEVAGFVEDLGGYGEETAGEAS